MCQSLSSSDFAIIVYYIDPVTGVDADYERVGNLCSEYLDTDGAEKFGFLNDDVFSSRVIVA